MNTIQLQQGNIIAYILRPSDQPTDPHKRWYGKVLRVVTGMSGNVEMVEVESLSPGYEGENELVFVEQIKSVR